MLGVPHEALIPLPPGSGSWSCKAEGGGGGHFVPHLTWVFSPLFPVIPGLCCHMRVSKEDGISGGMEEIDMAISNLFFSFKSYDDSFMEKFMLLFYYKSMAVSLICYVSHHR